MKEHNIIAVLRDVGVSSHKVSVMLLVRGTQITGTVAPTVAADITGVRDAVGLEGNRGSRVGKAFDEHCEHLIALREAKIGEKEVGPLMVEIGSIDAFWVTVAPRGEEAERDDGGEAAVGGARRW